MRKSSLNIDQLMSDADSIIEKVASRQSQSKTVEDSEIDSLLREFTKVASQESVVDEEASKVRTLIEKVAYARAIDFTIQAMPTLQKIAQFEKTAKAKGYSDEQIQQYFEKSAAGKALMRKLVPYAAGAGALGATGAAGYKKGKSTGRDEALDDVNQILTSGYFG